MSNTQVRTRLLRIIQNIPSNKLKEIESYLSKLEIQHPKTDKNFKYAGAWKDIDEELFEDFTENLIERREKNLRRLDE